MPRYTITGRLVRSATFRAHADAPSTHAAQRQIEVALVQGLEQGEEMAATIEFLDGQTRLDGLRVRPVEAPVKVVAMEKPEAVPKPQATPLEIVHRVWRHIPERERVEFLMEMLTPQERRALHDDAPPETGAAAPRPPRPKKRASA
jgi:hypothetical protein